MDFRRIEDCIKFIADTRTKVDEVTDIENGLSRFSCRVTVLLPGGGKVREVVFSSLADRQEIAAAMARVAAREEERLQELAQQLHELTGPEVAEAQSGKSSASTAETKEKFARIAEEDGPTLVQSSATSTASSDPVPACGGFVEDKPRMVSQAVLDV